jgi:hypothetical protein
MRDGSGVAGVRVVRAACFGLNGEQCQAAAGQRSSSVRRTPLLTAGMDKYSCMLIPK